MTPADLTSDLRQALAALELVAFDFDGVFTDNRVIVDQDGIESVVCSRADGFGIAGLRSLGIEMVVLSTEVNPVVTARCKKLHLRVAQGLDDKTAELRAVVDRTGVTLEHTAFVGNDLNDIGCLDLVGVGVCVADAYAVAAEHADFVLETKGGYGAVREFCDLVIACKREMGGL